jgi:hypothetical protein
MYQRGDSFIGGFWFGFSWLCRGFAALRFDAVYKGMNAMFRMAREFTR